MNNKVSLLFFSKSLILLSILYPSKSLAETDSDCYLKRHVGTVGFAGTVCANKLIVDRSLLIEGINGGLIGSDYQITKDSVTYNFGDTGNRIFTGQVKNFSNLFKDKSNFNADIGYWDTSNATSMNRMFMNASTFNQDISNWSVSNVTKIQGMFQNAIAFNQDIGSWNISKVTSLNSTFRQARSFNQDINNWDVSNVTRLDRTFFGAINFNQDLNNWNVSKVVNMHRTFAGAIAFNGNISNWNTESLRSLRRSFDGARSFNKDLSGWDVTEVTNFTRTFKNARAFDQNLSGWNVLHFNRTPKLFAPLLAKSKRPCWGFNGCPVGPELTSTSPTDNSFSASNSTTLILNFDKDIKVSSTGGNIELRNYLDDSLVNNYNVSSINISNNQATLSLSLGSNTDYYILIDPGSIEGTNGISYIGITDKNELNFSTTTSDSVAPYIVSQSPDDDASDISTSDPTIELIFNEDINIGTGNISIYNYANDSLIRSFNVATNTTDLSVSGNELYLSLRDTDGTILLQDDTQYYILISSGAVVDKASSPNSFAGISSKDSYNFTTSSSSCGSISGIVKYKNGNPANGTNIKLYKDDSLVQSTTTNSVGNYSFLPSTAGTYKVEFIKSAPKKRAKGKVDSIDGPQQSGRFIKNIVISSSCEDFLDLDGILIDPAGVIYDSLLRTPISGAKVKLYFDNSLVNNDWLDSSGGENIQTTDSDGKYSFVLKADTASSGIYTITIEAPSGYGFESTKIPANDQTYIPSLGGGAENIQAQDSAPTSGDITTYYLSFNFTFTGNSATSSNGVVNNHIPLDAHSDPTLKADVVGLAEAWSNAAIRFSKSSMDAVNRRLNWLKRNKASDKKSHQGIDISFSNPILNKVINGNSKRLGNIKEDDLINWSQKNWNNTRLVNKSDEVIKDLQEHSVDIAMAEIRHGKGDINLNPSGSQIMGNWSLWTDGQLTIGNSNGSSVASTQKSDTYAFTFGIDKPYKEKNLFGIAFTFGGDDIDIGNAGSQLKSDNYSVSIYSSNKPKKFLPIELQFGLGRMELATKRIEESIVHTGSREANMIFGSAAVIGESISKGNFLIKPYGRFETAQINFDEFSEAGSHLALTFKKQKLNRKIISAGFDINYEVPLNNWMLRPFGKVAYNHDLTDDSIVDMHYVSDSQNYRLIVDKISNNSWETALGIELLKNNALSANLSYEREQSNSSFYSDSYQFQINWKF